MEEWKECIIGDICESVSETYSRRDENVVLINTSDVLEGKFLTHETTKNENLKGQFKKTFQKDDILYSEIRPANRRYAFVDFVKTENYIASTKLMVIRPNQELVLPRFLYLLLTSNNLIDEMQHLAETRSGTFPQITFSGELATFPIKLPPLPIQQKIAAILSSLDDKIELNNKINTNLEQQAQALFKNWFVDFEPFGGKMPERWKMGTIADFGDVVCGKTPSTKVKDYYGDKTPFITIPDMHNNVFACYTERYLSEKGELSQKGKTLPQNSVCVSCIATPGLVVMVDEPSQTNQQINSIIPKDNMSSCYVYLTMYYLADTIKMLGSSGSTTANLNKEQFSKIAVLIPTTKDLQNFDKLIKPIFENIKNNQHENKKLTSLRDTLLPKLMNGEINV